MKEKIVPMNEKYVNKWENTICEKILWTGKYNKWKLKMNKKMQHMKKDNK